MTSARMIGVEVESGGDKGQTVAHSRSSVLKIGAEGRDQPVTIILTGDKVLVFASSTLELDSRRPGPQRSVSLTGLSISI